jgi:hypothetical protein
VHGGRLTEAVSRAAVRSVVHPPGEVRMSEMPEGLPEHPIGTFAFVGTYALVFVILWFAIYRFVFLARHPLTP